MLKQRNQARAWYVFLDYVSASIAWICFYSYRKIFVEGSAADIASIHTGPEFYTGIILLPFCWLAFYYITGVYGNIYRKSRINEFTKTLLTTLIGVTIIFFAFILDDIVLNYKNYYQSYIILFFLHLFFTLCGRYLVLYYTKKQIAIGQVGFNTLIIGGNQNAVNLYNEIAGAKKPLGYRFVGFINTNGNSVYELEAHVPCLGHVNDLNTIIEQKNVEEVIIAIETSEQARLSSIINSISHQNVIIKIIPGVYDILSGSVKMGNIFGAILIEIYPNPMPVWQRNIKRLIDVVISVIILTIFSPLFLFIALRVKLSSPGPVIYMQERLGRFGKPFLIFKFRSMYVNAEDEGPALSHATDSRITKWGRVIRKWRMDELPQFFNVLIGDMSIVGPRPERAYFIEQIIKTDPHYKHLLKVKPGITSWGMVKYGYAENVQQMLTRMKYDLLYVENMSLLLDFKIMAYTVMILFQGKGK